MSTPVDNQFPESIFVECHDAYCIKRDGGHMRTAVWNRRMNDDDVEYVRRDVLDAVMEEAMRTIRAVKDKAIECMKELK